MGMHRTGSTLLQNLLDQDPNSRTTRLWETFFSIPPAKATKELRNNHCIDKLDSEFSNMAKIFPGWYETFIKMHFFSSASPEEDCILLNSLFQNYLESYKLYNVDPEMTSLIRENSPHACRFLHLFLKIQNHSLPPISHWLLKNPNHSQYLKEFFDEFPRANVVVTHRDPVPVVASWTTFCLISSFPRLQNDFKKVSLLCVFFSFFPLNFVF